MNGKTDQWHSQRGIGPQFGDYNIDMNNRLNACVFNIIASDIRDPKPPVEKVSDIITNGMVGMASEGALWLLWMPSLSIVVYYVQVM